MIYFILWILFSWLIGTPISSFFSKRRNEKFFFYRGYELYKSGQVDRLTLIMGSILNIIIGSIILVFIFLKIFDSMLPNIDW